MGLVTPARAASISTPAPSYPEAAKTSRAASTIRRLRSCAGSLLRAVVAGISQKYTWSSLLVSSASAIDDLTSPRAGYTVTEDAGGAGFRGARSHTVGHPDLVTFGN